MDYHQLISQMTPDIYHRMVRALEIGRWPDGRALTPQQMESTMQAVIAWGEQHLPEHERVGFIDKGKKATTSAARAGSSRQQPSDHATDEAVVQPLNWKD